MVGEQRRGHELWREQLQAVADAVLAGLRRGEVEGLGALPELAPVQVRLSARLTRSAGIYRPAGDIAISTHFLAAHGVEGARGVLLHEIAHHVVQALHGRRALPHGPAFKHIAAVLGADLRAEHFAAPRLVYVYRCPFCGWEWRRGRRIPRGRRYSCARCAPVYDERRRLVYMGSRREAGEGQLGYPSKRKAGRLR